MVKIVLVSLANFIRNRLKTPTSSRGVNISDKWEVNWTYKSDWFN